MKVSDFSQPSKPNHISFDDYSLVIGAQNFLTNDDLKLDENGDGSLYQLHRLVVADLPKLVDSLDGSSKNLIERWIAREQEYHYQYFAFYQKDSSQKIISIITGVIDKDFLQVINTATSPKYQRQGMMEDCLYSLFLCDQLPDQIKFFEGSLSTGINATKQYQENSQLVEKLFSQQLPNLLALINQDLSSNSLTTILHDDYQITRTNPNSEIQLQLFHANKLLQKIKSSNLWQKTNFKVLEKLGKNFDRLSSSPIGLKFVIGNPSNLINLIAFCNREKIKTICQEIPKNRNSKLKIR